MAAPMIRVSALFLLLCALNLKQGSSPYVSSSKVLELSDRFLEFKNEGLWLVKFYAPWCGHCKRLEPIWNQVAQTLHDTPIRVARVDCTRFVTVATQFGVKGFPTILFLKGPEVFTYKGERSREEIVEFAHRMAGPPIKHISNGEFGQVHRSYPLFFVFTGSQEGSLWESYTSLAPLYQIHHMFYTASQDCIAEKVPSVDVNTPSAVYIFKDGTHFQYQFSDDVKDNTAELNNSLHSWIKNERFLQFPKITYGNWDQLLVTEKLIAMVVVEEDKVGQLTPNMTYLKELLQRLSSKRDKYHNRVQFGWAPSPELANSIAMQKLSLPAFLVINTSSFEHHLPDDDPNVLTPEAVEIFLEQVLNGTASAYGGTSVGVRAYRMWYEGTTSIQDMWKGNPVLTTVLFGLPLGFLSLICYSICCQDILDANEEEEQANEHEKKD